MVTGIPTAGARDLLGEIVTWEMGSMELPLSRVRQAMDDTGLPVDALGDLRSTTAFGRAVRELRENRTIDKIKADNKSGVIQFQFTRKALDEASLKIDFNFEATAHLDTTTGDITCPDSPAIEAHARAMFAHAMQHRSTSDVTRLVQRLFEKHADLYPINPRKGVAYFVPEKFRSFSAQMEDFLGALGGSLLRFPVPRGTVEGNRAVKISMEQTFATLVHELDQAVDLWSESTREATMEHKVQEWQVIRHKVESYGEYLGDGQARLLAALDAAKGRLAAKVTVLKENTRAGTAEAQTSFLPADEPAYSHVEAGELPDDFHATPAGELATA